MDPLSHHQQRFKTLDFLHYVPTLEKPVLTFLMFPPASHTPSGFYKIEPNGVGGNKIELVKKVDVDPRTAKAWYVSCSERQRIISQELASRGEVHALLAAGMEWSSLPAEKLVERIMNDPTTRA